MDMGGGMELPPEHINFGNCNIRPGRNPSFSPPTTGFTIDFTNDYPNQDTNYAPICSIEKYPQAYEGDAQGQFGDNKQDTDHNITIIDKNPPAETTKTLGIKSMHIPDSVFIEYKQYPIPNNGPHRTMWAAYGDYHYCPPTRYMHNLEHGAIVFLYHVCAINEQVKKFKNLAKNCLWKHVISGWENGLNETYPFAVVAWHKVLYLKNLDDLDAMKNTVVPFIQRYAKAGGSGEGNCWGNGGFVNQLIKNASIVTSVEDTEICPNGYVSGDRQELEVENPIKTITFEDEITQSSASTEEAIISTESAPTQNDTLISSTQTPIENKIAELQQETTTLAQAISDNSDKIFHEAVLATFSVLFLQPLSFENIA